jgi:hypothetical protein
MEEMPGLVKLAGEEAGKGVVFAGISLDQDSDGAPRMKTLREFAAKAGVTYPILVPDVDSSIFQTTTAIPQTMLIDKHGRRARTILGEATMEELRAAIDQLVSEP